MSMTFHKATRVHGVLTQAPDRNNNFMRCCNIAGWPGVRFQIVEIESDSEDYEWYTVRGLGDYKNLVLLVAPRLCGNVY